MSQRSVRPAPARALLRLAVTGASCTLLLATAAGCGSEGGDGAGAANESPTSDSPTSDSSRGSGGQLAIGETVEPGQAVIVSASNVDGDTSTLASALVDDTAVSKFVATMEARLAEDVRAAVRATQVPADSTLFGAVVSVGCQEPTAIAWSTTFDGIEVTPTLPKSEVQCLVPVTSVALFLVPD
jgi:hypothetical protein